MMDIDESLNNERLQRAIKCLQLIQRTNPQKSAIAKAAAKAILPLLAEAETRPLPAARTRKAKHGAGLVISLAPPAAEPQVLLEITKNLSPGTGEMQFGQAGNPPPPVEANTSLATTAYAIDEGGLKVGEA
jgi:hypothetical protein